MSIDYQDLLPIAHRAVDLATEIIRTHTATTSTAKGDRDMATNVDYAVEHAVRDLLRRETPEIRFYGEEEGAAGSSASELTWLLDPLDGTANFTHGIPLCAVSLGLAHLDHQVLGVIDLPFLSSRYHAAEHCGAYCNGEPISVSATKNLSEAIVAIGDYAVGDQAEAKNRLRLAVTSALAAKAQRVRMHGSAAIDLAWLAHGRLDAVIILSNKPWDTTAGVAISREAGAAVVGADGNPHDLQSIATAATNSHLTDQILDIVRNCDLEPA